MHLFESTSFSFWIIELLKVWYENKLWPVELSVSPLYYIMEYNVDTFIEARKVKNKTILFWEQWHLIGWKHENR